MATDEYGVTEDGFVRKTFEEIVNNIEKRITDRLGDDVYLGKESPLRHIIESVGYEIAREWDTAEHMYASAFINEASGANLEKLCALAGVSRLPASFSTGQVTFEGDSDSNPDIGKGFNVATEDGIVFETTESGTIGSDGTLTLDVQSTERGSENNVAPATITVLEDEKSGVFSVSNAEKTTGGEDKETDKELRLRTSRILEERGNATLNAIRQRLLDYEGITAVSIRERTDEVFLDVTVGGLGDYMGTEDEENIHDIMDEVRAYGVEYKLYAPTEIDIQVGGDSSKVTIKVDEEYPDGAVEELRQNIYNYINDLSVGEDVLYAKLYDIIYNTGEWVYNINNLQLAKLGNALSTEDISIVESSSELAVITDGIVNEDEWESVKHDADAETATTTWDSGDSIPFYFKTPRIHHIDRIEREDGSTLDTSYYTVDYSTDEAVEIDSDTGEQYLTIYYVLSDIHIDLVARS